MNRLDELGIPYKRLVRDDREVLLVPTIYDGAVETECIGCVFNNTSDRPGASCHVRWKLNEEGYAIDNNHVDCMFGPANDQSNPGIYIDPNEIEQYLAAYAVAKLEGDDDAN